jgi:hypothetical protein
MHLIGISTLLVRSTLACLLPEELSTLCHENFDSVKRRFGPKRFLGFEQNLSSSSPREILNLKLTVAQKQRPRAQKSEPRQVLLLQLLLPSRADTR